MKILHTCLSQSWGGLEMYSLSTVRLLLAAGAKVELLCYPDSRLHIEAIKCGVIVHTLRFPGITTLSSIVQLKKLLQKNQYAIIHSEASKDLWVVVPALALLKSTAPLILSKHMGSFIVKKDLLHRWVYRRVTRALAISRVIQKNLQATTPLEEHRITLLHDAVDIHRFDPSKVDRWAVRKEFAVRDDELLVGMTSRFSPGKGHEEFLAAACTLAAQYDHVKFLIVGEASKGESYYEEVMRSMAAQLGLSERVIFTGYRSDIPEVLAALDIFVLPSHAEAFGMSLIEAMSMNLPSVCSNSDGVLDIALDGVTSYLFEVKNSLDLAAKIRELIDNPHKRKELAINGRKRVMEHFSYEIFASNLLAIYKDVLS